MNQNVDTMKVEMQKLAVSMDAIGTTLGTIDDCILPKSRKIQNLVSVHSLVKKVCSRMFYFTFSYKLSLKCHKS